MPGRELVDQRIVGRQTQRLPEQRRLVAHQVHDLLQVRGEQLEAVLPRAPRPSATSARDVARARREISETGVAMA